MHGKRMPVNAPLPVVKVQYVAGQVVTTIDRAHSHFVTCPDATTFKRARVR
jgi:hypothetical protein